MNRISEKDRQYIWHPYTQHKTSPDFIPISRGQGAWLYDEQNRGFIDAISSWWTTIHGHGHPHIAEKIRQQALQLEHVIFAGFTHEPAVELAERLIPLLPKGIQKVFFSDNGSTAVEVALKMAIQYQANTGHSKRKKIIALQHSYHGDTFGAMSISEPGIFTQAFQSYLFSVDFIELPLPGEPFSLPDLNWEEYAAFIYEPLVQGAGGMRMYDVPTLETLLSHCRANRILCIADEVMTGFGRTGTLFASESIAILPDIVCLSKGLTGGTLPMAITACTGEIFDAFLDEQRLKTFFHGHSFTANPIGCAAALASLDLLLDSACLNNIRRISEAHSQKAREWKDRPGYLQPRSKGTILAFEIESPQNDYLNTKKEAIMKRAMEKQVLLRPLGNTVYCMPPYCISEEELNRVYAVIDDIS